MSRVLVVAPHPDDETLGCGGALLRHRAEGDSVHWLIVTAMREELGYGPERIAARDKEIDAVAKHYGFAGVHRLGLPTTRLDTLPLAEVIEAIAAVLKEVAPETLYVPFGGDAHSDHRVAFDACISGSKWFRAPALTEVLAYETLSETDFRPDPAAAAFRPNLFVDIEAHLDGKIRALRLYEDENRPFPFPRSEEAIVALARKRGTDSGFRAAEAFLILRQRR